MGKEIYYAEDDRTIAGGVKTYLEERGFHVTIFGLVSEIRQALQRKAPDAVLVDWNLPDGSGEALCGWIRRRFGDSLPVLFLTVKGETADVVKGFHSGADDYVVKPFDLEVLYSRIQAVLRRADRTGRAELFCDGIRLDREKTAAYNEEGEVALSPAEYKVLAYLMEHKGKTVTRRKLLEELWDANENYVNDNTLTVTMKRLRGKFGNPACIKTVRSFGYRMEDTL